MAWLQNVSQGFFGICSTVASTIGAVSQTVNYVLKINYEIVSTVYYYSCMILSTVGYILGCIFGGLSAVMLYAWEFFVELYGCVCAFFVLIWRLLVLIYKIVCLVFTGVETLAVVLWTGSYVTVKTLKQSVGDVYDYCDVTWNHATQMLQDFVDSIVSFFASIGNTALNSVIEGVNLGILGITAIYNCVVNCAVGFQNFILNFCNNVIYFYTSYLPSLGKETYLGIVICCLLYFGIFKLICFLNCRGMTLFTSQRPSVNSLITVSLDSDDEVLEQTDSEASEFHDDSDISDNDSDAMTEHTVEDHDDEDSELSLNSQTFSSSDEDEEDIEVELPQTNQSYGLRHRSMTPKRSQALSPDEFEREIEKEKDKRKCVVCQDESKSVLILPCRHMCLCVGCANQIVRARYIERRVCPLCRQRIQKVMNVYT